MLILSPLVATYFLGKGKQKARASHPKNGDLNFLDAEEKTPSPTARCRLADFRHKCLTRLNNS